MSTGAGVLGLSPPVGEVATGREGGRGAAATPTPSSEAGRGVRGHRQRAGAIGASPARGLGLGQCREGRGAVVMVPGKGGGAAGGQYRGDDCRRGLGMGPVPPAALSPPGGVGRDRLPPAAADVERRNESEPELPLSPGAPGGAGPQCGGRAGGQRDPRTREGAGGGGRRVNGRRANMADSAACER